MVKSARFQVDPRLASLLGEGYRSSEEALKELVDNAWDADAERVRIQLPHQVTPEPIIIEDDGTGMSDDEVRKTYLVVARDRRSREGLRTARKSRVVKGMKGIGKFAGLMAAEEMLIETRSQGRLTRLRITKSDLHRTDVDSRDLEQIDLPIEVSHCGPDEHGTKITLSHLSQNLAFPSAEKLKQLLVMEYGRQEDFAISVNGERVTIDDIPGQVVEEKVNLPGVGEVRVKFSISEGRKPLKQSGIAVRVGGKLVGRPMTLGLEDDETIPPKLLKRIYGEVEANGLKDDVTADWGAVIENSKAFQQVKSWAADKVGAGVKTAFKKEVGLHKARLKQQLNRRLAQLPENRRQAAEEAINRVLQRFYGESEERIEAVVSVMLDAFERDEYWAVLQKIDKATHLDVAQFAEALGEFGLVDLAVMGHQARNRLSFLDQLDRLIRDPKTEEGQLHGAIATNLWVLGSEYALISSNKTLRRTVREWADKTFSGSRSKMRPDLFLAQEFQKRYVLIEFKRPSHAISRDDEHQAVKYRDDLAPFTQSTIEIVLIGGSRSSSVSTAYGASALRIMSYVEIISMARAQLNWLLSELGVDVDSDPATGAA